MHKCSIPDCNNNYKAKGFCSKHYYRFKRNGDPLKTHKWYGIGKTPEERFWSKVNKYNKCWEWMGSKTSKGYGDASYQNKNVKAHRLAWFFIYGKWPQSNLLHSCDNPICVNPKHLREGTKYDNSKDMVERGRSTRGTKNPQAKLNEQKVLEIRNLIGTLSYSKIAKQYNVSVSCVQGINNGKIWGWL